MAAEFKRRIERLLSWRIMGETPDPQTARWIEGLPDDLHEKLAQHGVLFGRETVPRLNEYLDKYVEQRRAELKPSSISSIERTVKFLRRFLDHNPRLDQITPDAATDWRVSLLDRELSEASVRLHCRNAKTVFGSAVERELIKSNPFQKLKSASISGDRDRYVTPDETAKILEACPNTQWRLLFALCRLAGLRCPSETHHLSWGDVDWDRGRMAVYAPKTDQTRVVPIVSQLMTILQDAFDHAEPGQTKIMTLSRNNLRRNFHEIIKRAGIVPWKHCFQTLRRSCETEWAQTFPQYAVSKWLGHGIEVSAKHYLTVTDDVYERAAGIGVNQGVEGGRHGLPSTPTIFPSPCSALQNALQ